MIPRECDNDDCDYETVQGADGRPRLQWVHVAKCEGPVQFDYPANVPPGSFAAYLLG